MNVKNIFKEEESIEILKILGLVNNIEEYQKIIIMPGENIKQEFKLRKIDEIRNYLFKETNQNELMTKKHKKVCRVFNYIKYLLIVAATITGCVSISAFFFYSWYSYRNYELCNWIKKLFNNCRN